MQPGNSANVRPRTWSKHHCDENFKHGTSGVSRQPGWTGFACEKLNIPSSPASPGATNKAFLGKQRKRLFLIPRFFFPTLSPSSPCVPLKSSRARGGESCFRSPFPAINSSGNCRRRREGGKRDLDQFCNWKTGRNSDERRCPFAEHFSWKYRLILSRDGIFFSSFVCLSVLLYLLRY